MKISELYKARKAEIKNGLPTHSHGTPEFDLIFELGSSSILSQNHRKGGNCYAEIEITVEAGEYWDHVKEDITPVPDPLVGVWYAEDVIMDYGESLTEGHLTHLRKRPTEITMGMLTKASEEEQRELFAAYNEIEPTGWDQSIEAHFVGFSMFADMLGEI